ncbi:ribonuclease P protein component [Candidatus Berkiella aquae]|uniref:Ribonuclease P protein component n=1 Tax=Candidatus Berkiella aquae TaxID=295108 RepID=A0AAE3HY94_9GAMM|nr:ribonuclease P protein component [Candidatus Berkiella aquae]
MPIIQQQQLCFPKKNRLLVPSDFQQVFKTGRRQKGAMFTIICTANALPYARLGLAIAKRYIPSAVARNRVRRIIRESFRHYQSILGAVDIVVITQKHLEDLKSACLHKELNQQWQLLRASLNKRS